MQHDHPSLLRFGTATASPKRPPLTRTAARPQTTTVSARWLRMAMPGRAAFNQAMLCLLALLPLAALTGCKADQQQTQAAQTSAETLGADAWLPLKVGDKAITAQLALNDTERARGLMGRKSLDTDHGMLFVFSHGQKQSFWMHNTPLPLDIGYFDNDGILREIYPLYPFDRTSVASRRNDIRYALEMSQGWFAQNGIRPGAQLDLEMLADALKKRGY